MNYNKQYLYQRVISAKAFIEGNYSTGIDLDQVISEAHFSKYHFIRLFKSIYGLTPHQYLTEIRIKKAKIELAESDNSIMNVCLNTGFQSLSSFIHLFKRKTGTSPLQYRKSIKTKLIEIDNNPLGQIPGCYVLKYLNENSNFQQLT